jgi:hypothetical protein
MERLCLKGKCNDLGSMPQSVGDHILDRLAARAGVRAAVAQ